MADFSVFLFVLSCVVAYLLGSIPTSVWVGKYFFKIDVREHGSGNAGATNTLRVLGYKTAIPVLLFDIFKGFIAVYVFYWIVPSSFLPDKRTYLAIAVGLLAVLGHIYSVFLRFGGGKGVATFAGVGFALSPLALLICFFVFLAILLATRYVSLGSIVTAISYPIINALLYQDTALVVLGIITAVAIVFTHTKNIGRLLRKEESKIQFKKK